MGSKSFSVTALIVTYNHERYIAAAIESALMQKSNFSIEILISEDASVDGTREIVKQYADARPDRITAIWSDRNLHSNEVVARGLRRAAGKYISLLDGDDLWISDTKLQQQADYLEAHPKISAVFHNALVATGDEVSATRWTHSNQQQVLTLEDIWYGNPFATCSGMLRTEYVRNMPSWYSDFFPITDWPLYVLCAQAGNLAFIDDIVGVYRLHSHGLFSALPKKGKLDAIEHFYRRMAEVLCAEKGAAARNGYSRYFFEWAKRCLEDDDLNGAFDCLRRTLRSGAVRRTIPTREALRFTLQFIKRVGSSI